jgi:hypothetical protein
LLWGSSIVQFLHQASLMPICSQRFQSLSKSTQLSGPDPRYSH